MGKVYCEKVIIHDVATDWHCKIDIVRAYVCLRLHGHQATFDPFCGLPPPLDRFLSLVVPDSELEFSAPPSVGCRCLDTDGLAGETSNGLLSSYASLVYQHLNTK